MAGPKDPPLQIGLVFRVYHGPTCGDGGQSLGDQLASDLNDYSHTDVATQDWQSCFGRCSQSPNVAVERWRDGALSEDAKLAAMLGGAHPDYRFEHSVTEADLPAVVERHLALYRQER